MTRFKHRALKSQITRVVLWLVLGTFLVAVAAFTIFEWRSERAALERHVATVADIVASRSTAALLFGDAQTANQMLLALKAEQDIELACTYAPHQKVVAVYSLLAEKCPSEPPVQTPFYRGSQLHVVAQSVEAGEVAGAVYLRATLRHAETKLLQTVLTLAAIFAITGIGGALIARRVLRSLTEPLDQLTLLADRIARDGSFDMPTVPHGSQEIITLWQAFAVLMAEISAKQTTLLQREENLRLTLNSIGDAVIVTDCNAAILRMNPVAEQLTGWPFVEAEGTSLDEVLPLIDEVTRKPIVNPVHKVLTTRTLVSMSNGTTLLARDSHTYQIADSAAPIKDLAGNTMGVIMVFRDVTEQYRMRRAMGEAQRNWQSLLDNMPAVAYGKDHKGRYLFISKEYETLFHVTAAQILGKTDFDIFPREYADKFFANDARALASPAPVYVEETAMLDDGPHQYLSVKFRVRSEQNDEYAVYGISTDITDLQRAEKDLVRQREEQQEILDNMADAVISVSAQGRVTSFNRAAEKMFDYARDLVLGMEFQKLLAMTAIGGPIDLRSPGSREVMGQRSSGSTFPMRLALAELIGGDTERCFIATCHDISAEKAQEEQLQRTQKMDSLGKLTGGIAHDINNLLGIILGYAEVLQRKTADHVKQSNAVSEIVRASERGKQLTDKLLAFSRKRAAKPVPTDINRVLGMERQMLEKTLTARIDMRWDLAEPLWPVAVDPGELEDAVINMSINAKYAMAQGGQLTLATRNVSLDAQSATQLSLPLGDYISLSVMDTGAGMDEETQRRMFEPFFSTKGEQGTGLGLAQVYGFVSRSGGAIKVHSATGQGTTIALYFPRHVVAPEVAETSSVDAVTLLSGGETILVVDDEPALRELCVETLSLQGYRVLSAENATQALTVLDTAKVDLLLSDIILPGMDGYQLAAQVKQRFPHIKIQLASGFSDERHAESFDPLLHAQRCCTRFVNCWIADLCMVD